MNGKTAAMAAGTLQLVELETVNDGFVKFFGNIVAIFDKDGYHNTVHRKACPASAGRNLRNVLG